jgi:signal transduction histidine kinase
MPAGGSLTIEVANVAIGESFALDRPEVASGHYVMLAVTDTGIGMSPEIQA